MTILPSATIPANTAAEAIEIHIQDLRETLLAHPLYEAIQSPDQLRLFMRSHVFAVWDFMSLLKRLQNDLTGMTLPWQPNADAETARFVTEIVLGEECDENDRGGHISHFALYREAMTELGADTTPIDRFLVPLFPAVPARPQSAIGSADLDNAFADLPLPEATAAFVRQNLRLALEGTTAEVAAAFCYGREDLIPEMFTRLLPGIRRSGKSAGRLEYYVQRHIALDGEQHGPLARRLIGQVCGDDRSTWNAARTAAEAALRARIALWDGILTVL